MFLRDLIIRTKYFLALSLLVTFISPALLSAGEDPDIKKTKRFVAGITARFQAMPREKLIAEWNRREKGIMLEYEGKKYYPGLDVEGGVRNINDILSSEENVKNVSANLLPTSCFNSRMLDFDYIREMYPPFLILVQLVRMDHPEYDLGFVKRWQDIANSEFGENIIDLFSAPSKQAPDPSSYDEIRKFIIDNAERFKGMPREELLSEWKKYEKGALITVDGKTYYPGLDPNKQNKIEGIEGIIASIGPLYSVWGNLLQPPIFNTVARSREPEYREKNPHYVEKNAEYIRNAYFPFLILSEIIRVDYPDLAKDICSRWQEVTNSYLDTNIDLLEYSGISGVSSGVLFAQDRGPADGKNRYKIDKNGYYYLDEEIPVSDKAERMVVLFNTDPHGYTKKSTRIIGHLKKIKENSKNIPLFLFGGDEPRGYPIWAFYKNTIGYQIWAQHSNAAGIGNHDLIHYGKEYFDSIIKDYGLPAIATNVVDKATGKYPYPRYKIIRYGGAKVLVLGFTTQSINTDKRVNEELFFDVPSKSYNELVPEILKEHNISNIFILAHTEYRNQAAGCEMLDEFVSKIGGKNIVIFHSHEHKSDYAISVNKDGNPVPILSGGEKNQNIKELTFDYRPDLNMFVYTKHETLDVDTRLKEDKETRKFIESYMKQNPVPEKFQHLKHYLFNNTYVDAGGVTRPYIWDGSRDYLNAYPSKNKDGTMAVDVPLTRLIGDAFRKMMNANVAFMESTSIRAGIQRDKVTGLDVFNVIPFENNLALASLTGRQIEDMVNEGLTKWSRRIHFSGLELFYIEDEGRYVVSRIYNPRAKKYERIDYDKKYVITAIDHFVGLYIDPSNHIVTTNFLDYSVLFDYIKKMERSDPEWKEKYQNNASYCPVVPNYAEYERIISDNVPAYSREYMEQISSTAAQISAKYSKMDVEGLISGLQPMVDRMNRERGYLSGTTPGTSLRSAAELCESPDLLYQVWGNVAMGVNPIGLLHVSSRADAELYFEQWKARYTAFVMLAEVLKKKYPDSEYTKQNIEVKYDRIVKSHIDPYKKYAKVSSVDKNTYMRLILRGIPLLRKQYEEKTTQSLMEELQANMDRINQNGYLSGFAPYANIKKAELLVQNAQDIYTLWANKTPSVAFLVEAKDEVEAMLYAEEWRNRFTTFMIAGELLVRLFPESRQAKLVEENREYYLEKISEDIRKYLPAEKKSGDNQGTEELPLSSSEEIITGQTVTDEESPVIIQENLPSREEFRLLEISVDGLEDRIEALDLFLKRKFKAEKGAESFELYPLRLNSVSGIGLVSEKGVIMVLRPVGGKLITFSMSELPEELSQAITRETRNGRSLVEILNPNDQLGKNGRLVQPWNAESALTGENVVITTLNPSEMEEAEGILFNTVRTQHKMELMAGGRLHDAYSRYLSAQDIRGSLLAFLGTTSGSMSYLLDKLVERMELEIDAYGKFNQETLSFLVKDQMLENLAMVSSYNSHMGNFFTALKDILKIEKGTYRTDYYIDVVKMQELKRQAESMRLRRLK